MTREIDLLVDGCECDYVRGDSIFWFPVLNEDCPAHNEEWRREYLAMGELPCTSR